MEAAEPLIKEENSKNFFMGDGGEDTEAQVVITGPPASRTVIDNLKRLLTQRQHSRESDAENKEVVPSTGSDLESDLSFYSMLTSSTSDSDDDFLRTSPENRKSNNNKRRPKRNLSTSSTSSSSSLSPVRERRKRPKTSKRGVKRYDSQMIILEDWNPSKVSKSVSPLHHHRHSPSSQGDLSTAATDPLTNSSNIVNINIMMNPNVKFDPDNPNNPSSSNKDSSSEDEHDHLQQHLQQQQASEKKNGSSATTVVRGGTTRLRKTRRDRDRRRKHHNSYSADHGRCQVRPLNHLNKPENYAVVIGNGNGKDIPKKNIEESVAADATISTNITAGDDNNRKRVGEEGDETEGKQVCRREAAEN